MSLNISVEGSSTSASTVSNCYTFHDIDSTWEEADRACKEMAAHLVTMETTEEWNKVRSLIQEKVKKSDSFTHWYIGLRHKSGTWKWSKPGSADVDVTSDDIRWQPSEPSNESRIEPHETCGEISSFIRKVYGHFNDVQCNSKYQAERKTEPRGYICEHS